MCIPTGTAAVGTNKAAIDEAKAEIRQAKSACRAFKLDMVSKRFLQDCSPVMGITHAQSSSGSPPKRDCSPTRVKAGFGLI